MKIKLPLLLLSSLFASACEQSNISIDTTTPSDANATSEAPLLDNPKKPNIILIVADDMGLTDLGAFGSEINTPNLDRIATNGVRLTNFHASPQCAPTRSILLSGTDNHTAGMGAMFGADYIEGGFGDRPGYEGYLHTRVASLPERLAEAGYRNYIAGKWHLGNSDERKPTARGFDEAFVLMGGAASHLEKLAHTGGNPPYREHGEIIDALPENFYSANTYTDKMIEYIGAGQNSGQPFFGFLALTSPHWPMHFPPEYQDQYAGVYDDGYDAHRARRVERATHLGVIPDVDSELLEPISLSWDELSPEQQRHSSKRMEIYAAMVDNMDKNVGRLMAYLEQIGELDNTLVFFMSDNGADSDTTLNPTFGNPINQSDYLDNSYENLGNASSWTYIGPGWAQAAMAPFRLYKGMQTEGGTRVSAFAYHPELVASSSMTNQYLSVKDVMPTLLDFAEAQFNPTQYANRVVEPIQGRSFSRMLQGDDTLVHPEDEVLAYELHGQRALVRGKWKLLWEQAPVNIWWADEPATHWKTWRLFNLEEDPTEQMDLSDTEPELKAELIALWEEYAQHNNIKESVVRYWQQPLIN